MSGIGSVGGASAVAGAGASEVDLQTLMMSVMMERSSILEDKVRAQADGIKQKNDTLKQINSFVNEARVNQNSAQALDDVNQLSATEANGKVTVSIGDYTLEVPKPNTDQSWTLTDADGNSVKIWGDPHVNENADGSTTDWDFKEQSTFMLKDGTKITVDTAPYKNNSNYTVTSSLTITRGDESVQVNGIDSNNVSFTDSDSGGRALDASTNDGTVFREGSGVNQWQNAAGERITSTAATRTGADMQAKTEIQNEVAVETNDIEMSNELKTFLAANPHIPYTDSDGDGKLTASEYKNLMASLEGERDSLSSTSQMEMTMLQSTMNKYNQSFEMLSNFLSKYNQSMSSITGNMR